MPCEPESKLPLEPEMNRKTSVPIELVENKLVFNPPERLDATEKG